MSYLGKMFFTPEHPFLTSQAITYLGSKRKQLAFIHGAIAGLRQEDRAMNRRILAGSSVAVDLFSGSGLVSRMLRLSGFSVHANDIEDYTVPINRAWLQSSACDVDALFEDPYRWLNGGRVTSATSAYSAILELLNRRQTPDRRFFSKHYAPASTNLPDFNTERLFYTQENASQLDMWMECLHDPFWVNHQIARSILISSVLYEMGSHINTSGTMRGFHRGWGGTGKDSIARIMAPLTLRRIPLIDATPGAVSRLDAIEVAKMYSTPIDLLYLDPPGVRQQYGSNYHLLNTFCRNGDFDPGPVEQGNRAGTRRDLNRSAYSSTRLAERAFSAMVHRWSDSTRYMLASYDERGILPSKAIIELLAADGRNKVTQVVSSDGCNHTMFVVKTNARQSARTRGTLLDAARDTAYAAQTEKYIAPEKLPPCFTLEPHASGWRVIFKGKNSFSVGLDRLVRDLDMESIGDVMPQIAQANLGVEERFKIYVAENRWAAALRLLGSLQGRRSSDAFKKYSYALRAALEERGNKRALLRLERLQGSAKQIRSLRP